MNKDVLDSRRRVSRRRALGLGGAIGLGGLLAACGSGTAPTESATATMSPDPLVLLDAAHTCTMAREETQGPYWFDVDSIRTDLREDRPGMPLTLALRVHDMSACKAGGTPAPVADSVVEIWHCDAGGVYSGFESASTGGAPGGRGGSGGTSDGSYTRGDSEASPTDDGTYLRGAQVAGANGIVHFTTIYPGWYRGRTVHLHLKVHVDTKTVLTTQLYLDETVNDAVFATAPYDEHTGRDTRNDDDHIFDPSGLLSLHRSGDGYLGVLNLGVDA